MKARYDISSLKGVIHGAAPCPVEIKRRIIEWFGPVVHEYYSATEGYGTVVDSTTWLRKPGTVGHVDPDHLYVGGADGERLPAGEEGLAVDPCRRQGPLPSTSATTPRPTAPTGATTSPSATSAGSTTRASSS